MYNCFFLDYGHEEKLSSYNVDWISPDIIKQVMVLSSSRWLVSGCFPLSLVPRTSYGVQLRR